MSVDEQAQPVGKVDQLGLSHLAVTRCARRTLKNLRLAEVRSNLSKERTGHRQNLWDLFVDQTSSATDLMFFFLVGGDWNMNLDDFCFFSRTSWEM